MFGNPGQALSSLGGSMKNAGNKLQQGGRRQYSGTMTPRQHKKMFETAVAAHREMAATETEHHGIRLGQSVDAATKLREAGFENVSAETQHVKLAAYGSKEDSEARAANPSAAQHGHPFAGHPYGAGTHPAASPSVLQVSPSRVTDSVISRPAPLALGAGKMDSASPSARPSGRDEAPKPTFVAGESVVKKGSFMDKPTKPQPALEGKSITKTGAIAMGSNETKGKLKGPMLNADPDSGAVSRSNKAGYEAKLSSQEAAHLASRKKKDDN